jgi:glutathione S-transferase
MLKVHRVPHSTNVERVALAAAHKGLSVEWVDHDPADRSGVRAVSGQDLVPVAELDGGEVVADSMAIVERLEVLVPDPPLYPRDPAAAARVRIFVEWFNRVWKVAPNAIEAGGEPAQLAAWAAELGGFRARFEALLAGGSHLGGDGLTAADLCAFPFLKWGAVDAAPPDAPRFEHILVEHIALGDDHPRTRAWIERMDRLPRA